MSEKQRIELFVFPDGTSVELIVFDADGKQRGAPAEARREAAERRAAPAATATPPASCPAAPQPADDAHAHVCPVCGSGLVYPLDWLRSGRAAWRIELRCPECETRREIVLGREAVEEFNRELYRGAQVLAREADRTIRRNFEDEADRIVAALEDGLILPMDF